jgi:DNA invertase Pin-like site-specific DNA recombinase
MEDYMIYGYARVSTRGQATDGFGLNVQKALLTQAGAERIFEESFTGTKRNRPELDKLMATIKSGDTLVVAKLDRIARSTIHGCEIINELLDRGVTVNVLNMGVMDNSTTGKLMRSIFLAFAEFERDMIVERTSEGKAIARQKEGYREGRKSKEIPDFQKFFQKQKDGLMTVNECCAALGISRSTWYARVREVS